MRSIFNIHPLLAFILHTKPTSAVTTEFHDHESHTIKHSDIEEIKSTSFVPYELFAFNWLSFLSPSMPLSLSL
jgi:hypothetical protein